MFFKFNFIILILLILINYCHSVETELLNKIKVLQFFKDRLTSGDKNGFNKSLQLVCVGSFELCRNSTIDKVVCHNSEYKNPDKYPKWTCLTQLKRKIIIKRKDIVCEHLNSDNNLIIKNSCSLHYLLEEENDLICKGSVSLYIAFISIFLIIILSLFIVILIRSNNRLYDKVIKLEIQNDHQFRNRFFDYDQTDRPPDYNDLIFNYNTNNVQYLNNTNNQFTNNVRYLNSTINNQFNNNQHNFNNDLFLK